MLAIDASSASAKKVAGRAVYPRGSLPKSSSPEVGSPGPAPATSLRRQRQRTGSTEKKENDVCVFCSAGSRYVCCCQITARHWRKGPPLIGDLACAHCGRWLHAPGQRALRSLTLRCDVLCALRSVGDLDHGCALQHGWRRHHGAAHTRHAASEAVAHLRGQSQGWGGVGVGVSAVAPGSAGMARPVAP